MRSERHMSVSSKIMKDALSLCNAIGYETKSVRDLRDLILQWQELDRNSDKCIKCPVCDGTGLVSKPPWVAGDQHEWSSTSTGPYPCGACQASGLLDAIQKRRLKQRN